MNIIEELENQFRIKCKKGDLKEQEKVAVNYLSSVNFRDKDIQSQAIGYVKHILTDFVEKNEQITSLEAKIMHCMLAKVSLANLELENVSIEYKDRTDKDVRTGAYYKNFDKSVTFFNNDVCNAHEFLNPYPTQNGEVSRLDYFVKQISVMQHEIQHAVQYRDMENLQVTTKDLNSDTYIICQQEIARSLAREVNSKYYNKEIVDKLYYENHDQFYYEIDADKNGIERTLNILKTISSKAYEIALDERRNTYTKQLNIKKTQLENYGKTITWNHNTNPNKDEVLATHKASMIIDTVLQTMPKSRRKAYFDAFPSLSITYNEDGTKKTLEQVERERQEKINSILKNGTDNEVQVYATKFAKLYDTAIESDAVLSLERSLQHVARLTWDSDRYFTDSGIEVKYFPSEIRKELKLATDKAMKIASTIEDSDSKVVKKSLDKYKKEVMNSTKRNDGSLRFFEDKKLAIYSIENAFYNNEEYKETIKQEEEKLRQENKLKHERKEKALNILKEVFPNFIPTQNINDDKLVNNNIEKLMLIESCSNYLKYLNSNKDLKNVIPVGTVRSAINEVYNFELSEEDKIAFKDNLEQGLVEVFKNKYELEPQTQEIVAKNIELEK